MQTALTLNLQGKCVQRQDYSIIREKIMFVLGIDVSKEKLDCYLASEVEEKPKHSSLFQVENSLDGFEKIALKLTQKGLSFDLSPQPPLVC